MSTARLTVGITDNGFRPYTQGDPQDAYDIDVPTDLLTGLSPEEIAEAAFVATNHPEPYNLTGLASWIARAVAPARKTHMRSLSVGDTVSFGDTRMVCEPAGWAQR